MTKFFKKTVQILCSLLIVNSTFAQKISYPEKVSPYDLVEVSAEPESDDYDLNWLIMNPVDMESKQYENNKYLVFVSPKNGHILILFQYVDYAARKSKLEKILIKVEGPVPPPPPPPPPPPDTDLDKLITSWLNSVPSEFRTPTFIRDIGQNYIIAAQEVSSSSENPRDDMVGRIKVLNVQTLGAEATRKWAAPFFLPLAKWMDGQNINAKDYEKHLKLFNDVGKSIRNQSSMHNPVRIIQNPESSTLNSIRKPVNRIPINKGANNSTPFPRGSS